MQLKQVNAFPVLSLIMKIPLDNTSVDNIELKKIPGFLGI